MRKAVFTARWRKPFVISLFDYAGLSRSQFIYGIEWLPEDLSVRRGKLSRRQRQDLVELCRRLIAEPIIEVDPNQAKQLLSWLRAARFVRLQFHA